MIYIKSVYDKLNEKSLYTPAKFLEIYFFYSCWFHMLLKSFYTIFKKRFNLMN